MASHFEVCVRCRCTVGSKKVTRRLGLSPRPGPVEYVCRDEAKCKRQKGIRDRRLELEAAARHANDEY